MKGGLELIQLLGKNGNWLIIHGHKHHPKISQANGSNSGPIIFSAGSLSARLYPELASFRASNQCYEIQFPLDKIMQMGLVGAFRAWDWNMGVGWKAAGKDADIPRHGGFGARINPKYLATRIYSFVKVKLQWKQISLKFPEIPFLLPQDLDSLVRELGERGMRISFDEHGAILELQRK
jgi:hypothetical protein